MKRVAIFGLCAFVAACAGILGLRRAVVDEFPHRPHVIAGVSCTKCHPNIADGKKSLHIPDDATCIGCHTKPHDTRSCTGCHTSPTTAASLIDARAHLKFDHAKHAGPTKGNCMHCHDGVAATGAGATRMRPPMATCFRCHDKAAERDARRCDACHTNLVDAKLLPESHLAHDGDWVREHGTRASSSGELCETCHQQSFCASCHGRTVPALPAARRFSDPLRPSIHRAGFAARHALEARSDPGACATCHEPKRCNNCHTERGVAGDRGRNPHPAGWVGIAASENRHGREARRDPAACAGCHGGAGEALCVSCHAVGRVGGNPHPAGFSSRQPLTSMPCRMCHPIGSSVRSR
jgi:Cytochrome c7 and related cytochrome c